MVNHGGQHFSVGGERVLRSESRGAAVLGGGGGGGGHLRDTKAGSELGLCQDRLSIMETSGIVETAYKGVTMSLATPEQYS